MVKGKVGVEVPPAVIVGYVADVGNPREALRDKPVKILLQNRIIWATRNLVDSTFQN